MDALKQFDVLSRYVALQQIVHNQHFHMIVHEIQQVRLSIELTVRLEHNISTTENPLGS